MKINNIDLTAAGKVFQEIKNWNADTFAQHLLQCVVDGHKGIYCGQTFTERFPKANIDDECWETVAKGPDEENYWECWDEITSNWNHESYFIYCGDSGDIFVYDKNAVELWENATNTDSFWDI